MNIPRFKYNPIDTSIVARMKRICKAKDITIHKIILNAIKKEIGIDPTLYRHFRGEDLVTARFLFMVMMVNFTKEPYRIIAGMVGKGHSTVNHAIKEVTNRCDTDKQYKKTFDNIESIIKSEIS